MPRISNWPAALNDAVELARSKTFAWGEHDCCIAAGNIALALTGKDAVADYRGSYSTEAGAAQVLAEHGGLIGTVAHVCEKMEWREVTPNFAQRGDIVTGSFPEGESVGVCCGKVAIFVGQTGAVFFPMSKISRAWRTE